MTTAALPRQARRRCAANPAASGETPAALALAAPGLILLLTLVVAPVAAVLVLSMTDWQFGAGTLNFVGLANFAAMWSDPVFHAALVNTAVYVVIVVPGSMLLGLLIALVIESGKSFRAVYRAIHFLPVMATMAAMAIAWESMLHPTIGLVNRILAVFGLSQPNWLGDPALVVPTLAAIGIWQHVGYAMVLFLAGIKAIPADLYDAAAVDGADSALDRVFTVTLPMLGPVTMFVTIIVALKAFEVFDTVQVLTQGGPGYASEMLLHALYLESFTYFRAGYGSALTVVFLVIVVALTVTQARTFDRKVHYT